MRTNHRRCGETADTPISLGRRLAAPCLAAKMSDLRHAVGREMGVMPAPFAAARNGRPLQQFFRVVFAFPVCCSSPGLRIAFRTVV